MKPSTWSGFLYSPVLILVKIKVDNLWLLNDMECCQSWSYSYVPTIVIRKELFYHYWQHSTDAVVFAIVSLYVYLNTWFCLSRLLLVLTPTLKLSHRKAHDHCYKSNNIHLINIIWTHILLISSLSPSSQSCAIIIIIIYSVFDGSS